MRAARPGLFSGFPLTPPAGPGLVAVTFHFNSGSGTNRPIAYRVNETGFYEEVARSDFNLPSTGHAHLHPAGAHVVYGSNQTSAPIAFSFTPADGFGAAQRPAVGERTTEETRRALFRPEGTRVVAGQRFAPFLWAWPYDVDTGFGAKYADLDPAVDVEHWPGWLAVTAGAILSTIESANHESVCAHASSEAVPLGTRYAYPAATTLDSVPGPGELHPDGGVFLWSQRFIGPRAIHWDDASGWGVEYAAGPTLYYTSTARYHPTGAALIVSKYLTSGELPYLHAIEWGVDGFGIEYADEPYGAAQTTTSPPSNFWVPDSNIFLHRGGASGTMALFDPMSGWGAEIASPIEPPTTREMAWLEP